MITKAEKYEYPMSGNYSETVATLADGRIVTVDTQYGKVLPHGDHAKTCDQLNKMGGRCNCGLLDDIDIAALLTDAKINGKRGRAIQVPAAEKKIEVSKHVCPKCGTYCCGDCEA